MPTWHELRQQLGVPETFLAGVSRRECSVLMLDWAYVLDFRKMEGFDAF